MYRLILVFLIIFIAFPVYATIDFYQDFESETVDEDWPQGTGCTGLDDFFLEPFNPKANCYDFVEDDLNDRSTPNSGAGNQYWSLYCDWTACADREDSQRHTFNFGQDTAWTPCEQMTIDDAKELWWAWSYYIPAVYAGDGEGQMVTETLQTSDNKILFALKYAINGNDYFRYSVYHDGQPATVDYESSNIKWTDLKGTWVDFVYHVVWYSTDDGNAIVEFYINGVEQFSYENVDNIVSGHRPVLTLPQLYNTGCYAAFDCGYCIESDTPASPWKEVHIDEFRLTENTIGTKDYCNVCPPIWPQTPTISYPGNGATGIDTTVTVTYGGYADHRTDAQGCFAYDTTEIQIDEDGGDWSTLIHEGEIDAETSHEISGLDYNTVYQMRVRHQSLRSGTADDYDSVWSDTVDFTTKASGTSPPMGVSNINAPGNLSISNINSGGLTVTIH